MKPRFSASEVAGILGRNPYKTKNEVLLKVISQMPQFKEIVLAAKTAVGGKTDKEFVDAAPHEVHVALAKCVREATEAKSDAVTPLCMKVMASLLRSTREMPSTSNLSLGFES